jgi:hypothetical protein
MLFIFSWGHRVDEKEFDVAYEGKVIYLETR